MAIKKALNKKKEPVKRAMKRAPAQAGFVDGVLDRSADPGFTAQAADMTDPSNAFNNAALENVVDPTSAEEDFQTAPLTPSQQAEKDALEGSNAAAKANNTTLSNQASVQRTARMFKDTVAYKELMSLPLEERRKLIEEDQAAQKKKITSKK